MPRLDTRLESAGAEFLVLGQLLLHKILSYKTYMNMPGYDLVAVNPEKNTSAKIQVKSRWRTSASGFPINNFGCDFLVAAFLNRGSKDGKLTIKDPDYCILPVDIVQNLPRSENWGKVTIPAKMREEYRNKWDLIEKFLLADAPACTAMAN